MPKLNNHSTLTRQWQVLNHIPSTGSGIITTALKDKLSVHVSDIQFSQRTLERDLCKLEEVGLIEKKNDIKPYLWIRTIVDDDVSKLDVLDAISIKIMEKTLKQLLPIRITESLDDRFLQAEKKLQSISNNSKYADWVNKVSYNNPTLPFDPPQISKGIYKNVQEALLENKQLEVKYLKNNSKKSLKYVTHPLGIVQNGPRTYLITYMPRFKNIIQLALHRIKEAIIIDDGIQIPKGFSLKEYINSGNMEFQAEDEIDLKIRLDKGLATQLAETPLNKHQQWENTPAKDGRFTLTTKIKDSWQLRWWLQSHAHECEVVKPTELREVIKERLTTALENHK